MKTCTKCGHQFEPTENQKRRYMAKCQPCVNAINRAFRERKKLEGVTYAGGTASKEWWKNYASNPHEKLRQATRARTRYAVKHGKLEKKPCEVCGNAKSQAHHEDYSDHMTVIWFCDTHHKEHHLAKAGA